MASELRQKQPERAISRMPNQQNLMVSTIGDCQIPSPLLWKKEVFFINQRHRVIVPQEDWELHPFLISGTPIPSFESAGPRKEIFFDPGKITCGLVTCGGLCPGINDVIRSIVLTSHFRYGVKRILGFQYGYAGLAKKNKIPPLVLTPPMVSHIHGMGGTILGSSRGPQDVKEMIKTLMKEKVKILFTIGGDGTLRGAHELAKEILHQKLPISVIGVPKTIDNDLLWITRSFGFSTAVEEARAAIAAAHTEASGTYNGVGLVKLMGRYSGFIAAHATLSNYDVNFCLVPEVPFSLDGNRGFLRVLDERLEARKHAVIVVAEGAGQDLLKKNGPVHKDASGNVKLNDIGDYLKERIESYFRLKKKPLSMKYIDPGYMIRGLAANAFDSEFCLSLGQNAVHAGMAGKTDIVIGFWNAHFTHLPISVVVASLKKLNPNGMEWQRVIEATGQPSFN